MPDIRIQLPSLLDAVTQGRREFEIEAKRARLVEAAQIAEELEDWAGATQAWRAILEFNEGDETVPSRTREQQARARVPLPLATTREPFGLE